MEIRLFCKPNALKKVGDCPFAHLAANCLNTKKVSFEYMPTPQEEKPQWLLDDYSGKMPCLWMKTGDDVKCVIESMDIADYIDNNFEPKGSLKTSDKSFLDSLRFFPTLAQWIKSKDEEKNTELLSNLEKCLDTLEQKLNDSSSSSSSSSGYLMGDEITISDCSLVPQLFVLNSVSEIIKGISWETLLEKRPQLKAYCTRAFESAELGPAYQKEDVIAGWKKARGDE